MRLSSKTHYLQIALNSSMDDARRIILSLPASERLIIEAGTPLIKRYGHTVISELKHLWSQKLLSNGLNNPYIVADMKCMDRGETEAKLAADAGASASIVLGQASNETLNSFIYTCSELGVDSMVDMMNVEKPYQILRKLKKLPYTVILHRGVDEEKYSEKMLPIHMINKVKGAFDLMISVAGGDKPREIQSSVFNGANIVVLWKNFFSAGGDAANIARTFLSNTK